MSFRQLFTSSNPAFRFSIIARFLISNLFELNSIKLRNLLNWQGIPMISEIVIIKFSALNSMVIVPLQENIIKIMIYNIDMCIASSLYYIMR
jgi:hypothetical protein